MLKRKIEDSLLHWKNSQSKKALCIIGARQIGKSTTALEFAKKHYESWMILDFIESREARQIFEKAENTEAVLEGLKAMASVPLIPGKTLIILDEIQECPAARTFMKYLVQEGSYAYIETGSLLGVKIKEIHSLPVGFEEIVNMYPLDFEEFLWATGIQDSVVAYLENCYHKRIPVSAAVHEKILNYFRLYLVVGGMPEAVQSFVDQRDIQMVQQIQKRILDLYKLDIAQYTEPSNRLKVQDLFSSVPMQLNEKNPRFYLTSVNANAKLNRYESSLVWLIESGTILPSYSVTELKAPLLLNAKKSLFRLFMSDSGLLCAALGGGIQKKIIQRDSQANIGTILENLFADLLVANGFVLYYFNSKKTGELDFVVELEEEAALVEIKSGKDYRNHPALSRILSSQIWSGKTAVVFCMDPGSYDGPVQYLPWYMVMFFKNKEPDPLILDLDLLIPEID